MNKPVFQERISQKIYFFEFDLGRCDTRPFGLLKVKLSLNRMVKIVKFIPHKLKQQLPYLLLRYFNVSALRLYENPQLALLPVLGPQQQIRYQQRQTPIVIHPPHIHEALLLLLVESVEALEQTLINLGVLEHQQIRRLAIHALAIRQATLLTARDTTQAIIVGVFILPRPSVHTHLLDQALEILLLAVAFGEVVLD